MRNERAAWTDTSVVFRPREQAEVDIENKCWASSNKPHSLRRELVSVWYRKALLRVILVRTIVLRLTARSKLFFQYIFLQDVIFQLL